VRGLGSFKYDMLHLVHRMREKYLVFTGRPNAGKSSVIREVTELKVPTGKLPGTTRRIQKYPLGRGLVLVDMPGFGMMMGASKKSKEKTSDMIIEFLQSNAGSIASAVHVLDISTFLEVTWRLAKKGFISLDVEMVQFLAKTLSEFPLVAANKIDKTNEEELKANLREFMFQISDGHPWEVADHVFAVSAKTGEGLGDLKSAIHETLVSKGFRTPFKTH
jgi:GTP-binding protein EngB required for normal cell division